MLLGCEWRHARKWWAENLVILKKMLLEIRLWAGPVQLGVDRGRCRDSWYVCHWGRQLKSDHGVLQISTDRDLGGYGMRSAFVGTDSTVSIVKNCVSLSSCRKTKVKKLINVSYLNNGESSVFRISRHLYICISVLWLYNRYKQHLTYF